MNCSAVSRILSNLPRRTVNEKDSRLFPTVSNEVFVTILVIVALFVFCVADLAVEAYRHRKGSSWKAIRNRRQNPLIFLMDIMLLPFWLYSHNKKKRMMKAAKKAKLEMQPSIVNVGGRQLMAVEMRPVEPRPVETQSYVPQLPQLPEPATFENIEDELQSLRSDSLDLPRDTNQAAVGAASPIAVPKPVAKADKDEKVKQ